MKKLIVLLITALLVFSLVGCGSEGGSSSSKASKNITMSDLDGEWIREDNGWPATISSGYIRVMESKTGSSSTTAERSIYSVENGVMSLSWEKGKDDYNIIVEDGVATRLEGEYTYVRLERPVVEMGETFTDNGIANVTITEISGYPRKLDTYTYKPVEDGSGLVTSDGMLFMEICYKVKTTYKSELSVPNAVQFTVVYGDGYEYSTEGDKVCYFREVGSSSHYSHSANSGKGSKMSLSPLTEKEYIVYIPVAEVLATDTETPMIINITLESDDSFAYGSVKVR